MTRKRLLRLLGSNTYDRLKQFFDLFWSYRRNSYSQNGEDIYLSHFFKDKQEGFYVDVGAFHPRQFSNTYLLYSRGWRGINIDANQSSINLFLSVRPRDINVFSAVSDNLGIVNFYKWGNSSGNTISSETATAMANENGPPLEVKTLEAQRLEDILNQHLSGRTSIDLLNVDVEGSDLSVLKSNNWSKYRPKIIVVEDFVFFLPHLLDSPVYQYLTSLNYSLAAWLPPSIIFKDASTSEE